MFLLPVKASAAGETSRKAPVALAPAGAAQLSPDVPMYRSDSLSGVPPQPVPVPAAGYVREWDLST